MADRFMVKVCGLRDAESLCAAARAGVDMAGFVFARGGPRTIDPSGAASVVAAAKRRLAPEGLALPPLVGLFVDADDAEVAEAAPMLDWIQCHGAETPARLRALKDAFEVKIMRAVGVAEARHVADAEAFAGVCDRVLFDARPPKGETRPGGHGRRFDWAILEAYRGSAPFMLAGGLGPDTVADAVAACGGYARFAGVDASTGVEVSPGVKDPDRIIAFARAARAAAAGLRPHRQDGPNAG